MPPKRPNRKQRKQRAPVMITPDGGVPRLTLRLLGPFEVRLNGAPLPRMRTRKAQWLLALLVLRGGRTPQVLARNKLDLRVLASPAVSGGKIFVRGDRQLVAIQTSSR